MKKQPLTPFQVDYIRSSNKNNHELADLFDRNHKTIWRIRLGLCYHKVDSAPLLVETPSCYNCIHWRSRCGLGKLDVLNNGPGFALDCDSYKKR